MSVPIEVGDELTIQRETILGANKRVSCTYPQFIDDVEIGDRVLIGMGAIVLSESTIGNECLIAAGAVVSPKVTIPDRSVVMGVPGRVAGYMCQCGIRLPVTPASKPGDVACSACGWSYRWDGKILKETGV